MDAANTFQSIALHKAEDGLTKILSALNKYFKTATETRQEEMEEAISMGSSSYKSNDAIAAIRSISNKRENELQAAQGLCDTLTSVYKGPAGMSSKCDQLDEFIKILQRRNEESRQETSNVLDRSRG